MLFSIFHTVDSSVWVVILDTPASDNCPADFRYPGIEYTLEAYENDNACLNGTSASIFVCDMYINKKFKKIRKIYI